MKGSLKVFTILAGSFFTDLGRAQVLAGNRRDPEFTLGFGPQASSSSIQITDKSSKATATIGSNLNYGGMVSADQRLSKSSHFFTNFQILQTNWQPPANRTLQQGKSIYTGLDLGFYYSGFSRVQIGGLLSVRHFPVVRSISLTALQIDNLVLFGPGIMFRIFLYLGDSFSLVLEETALAFNPESTVDYKLNTFLALETKLQMNFKLSKSFDLGLSPYVNIQSADTSIVKQRTFYMGGVTNLIWKSW